MHQIQMPSAPCALFPAPLIRKAFKVVSRAFECSFAFFRRSELNGLSVDERRVGYANKAESGLQSRRERIQPRHRRPRSQIDASRCQEENFAACQPADKPSIGSYLIRDTAANDAVDVCLEARWHCPVVHGHHEQQNVSGEQARAQRIRVSEDRIHLVRALRSGCVGGRYESLGYVWGWIGHEIVMIDSQSADMTTQVIDEVPR